METGENGMSGVPVVKHAKKENNQEPVNAIHLLLSMVARIAEDSRVKLKIAMGTSHAQVSFNWVRFRYTKQNNDQHFVKEG